MAHFIWAMVDVIDDKCDDSRLFLWRADMLAHDGMGIGTEMML
jgi:hypothetical protein